METKIQSYNRYIISTEYTRNSATIIRAYDNTDELVLKRTYFLYDTQSALKEFKTILRQIKK